MAENNLGNTQYFRTKPDADLEVKEVLDLVYNAMDEKGYNPVTRSSAILCPEILPILPVIRVREA